MTIENIMPLLGLIITLLTLWWTIWKWSSIVSSLENTNKLQQKDIDALIVNKEKMREKVNNHEEKISNIAVEFAKMNANLMTIKENVDRILDKLPD